MIKNISASRILNIYLVLVALHSFCVGIGLIFLPASQMALMGFNISGNFFPDQGGIFQKYYTFIFFTIVVKFIATVFLFTYYLFINPILMVLISGIFDFLIGLVLLIIYNWYKKTVKSQYSQQQ